MHAGVWQTWLPTLSQHFRVTTLELPGHGASPVMDAVLSDWSEACLAIAPPGAIWLGWSLGGLVALQAAKLAGEQISQLCLMASTPCFVQTDDWQAAVPETVFRQFADTLRSNPVATLRRFLSLQVRGSAEATKILRGLQQSLAQRSAADPVGLAAGLNLLLQTDLRAELAQLTVPSTWLFGGRDTLVPAAVADHLPDCCTVRRVPLATHAPFLTHPADCSAWLEPFFGDR
jgi:pimeloyl-[acyl-carrier protein] methyl ester esterase